MLATVTLTWMMLIGGAGNPCGPEYMPTYPGAHVREALFADLELSTKQCEKVEEITRDFHQYLRSLNTEWGGKPLEERRRKMRELYWKHAETLFGIGTPAQRDALDRNLLRVRELLRGDVIRGGSGVRRKGGVDVSGVA